MGKTTTPRFSAKDRIRHKFFKRNGTVIRNINGKVEIHLDGWEGPCFCNEDQIRKIITIEKPKSIWKSNF